MLNNLILQLNSFIYVAILSIVYFAKRKYNFVESKIYKILLIIIMITIIFDSIGIISENTSLFIILYKICLYIWLALFLSYTFLSCSDKKYEKIKEVFKEKKIAYLWLVIIIIMFIFLIVSHIRFDIHIIYIFGIAGALLNLLILLIKIKKLPKYKKWSIFTSDVILLITMSLQITNNDITIVVPGIALITLVQYFVMENPDLKYIDELNILKDKAEEANRAKTNFLASMSHEIRTPMNVVIGFSKAILDSNIPDEFREDVKNINEAGNILLEIVNNVLDITKIEEGKIIINDKPYSLADTLAKISHMVEISLMDKPVKYEVKVIGNIPNTLMGDGLKVYQVLMNILSNSIKYTKKGNINLTVYSTITGNKDMLTFKISDTGMGIKKADNEKLFKEFERLDQENSDIQGSGLGLVITKQLVNLMGGKINFESTYGEGTTFTINLEQEIVDRSTIDFSTYQAKKVTIDEYFDGSKYKVLLVDDNVLNLKVAEKMLKKYNFTITSVRSGLACINYTKSNNYDIVFMDHMMPEMDGIQTLYNLKKRATGFDTPVVVLTANVTEGAKTMYLKEGFCDYLSKPIDVVELDNILRKYLKIPDDAPTIKKEKVTESSTPADTPQTVSSPEPIINNHTPNTPGTTTNNIIDTNTNNIDNTQSTPDTGIINNVDKIFPDV